MSLLSRFPQRTAGCAAAAVSLLLSPASFVAAQGTSPEPSAAAAATPTPQKRDRLVSMVLLLEKPRKLTAASIAKAASEATGATVSAEDVVSKPPYYLLKLPSAKFIINDVGQRYVDKNAKLAEGLDPKVREGVVAHQAWISVDWPETEQAADLKPIYQQMARIAVQLAGTDTLAVYNPDLDRFVPWNAAVREDLKGEDPLAVFEPKQTAAAETQSSSGASPVESASPASPARRPAEPAVTKSPPAERSPPP